LNYYETLHSCSTQPADVHEGIPLLSKIEGRMDGQTDEWTNGRTDGRTPYGRTVRQGDANIPPNFACGGYNNREMNLYSLECIDNARQMSVRPCTLQEQLLLSRLLNFYETLHICSTLPADVHEGLWLDSNGIPSCTSAACALQLCKVS
jgi:hypothetical protein